MLSLSKLAIAIAALPAALAAALPADPVAHSDIAGGTLSKQGPNGANTLPPIIVSIGMNNSQWCDGVLLNAHTVVTAAHCSQDFSNPDPAWFTVRAGSLAWNSSGVASGVSRFVVHPGYNPTARNLDHDIGLWHLTEPIHECQNIAYATLPAQGFVPPVGANVIAAGWGSTDPNLGDSPKYLLQITYPVISQKECQAPFDAKITSDMFCASAKPAHRSACYGDSGGPVIDAKSKTLWGLINWGTFDDCGGPKHVDVFVRISSYIDWIHKHKF